MRILHAIANLDAATGGPATACLAMARAVARRGHRVAIYAGDVGTPPPLARQAEASGVALRLFPVQWTQPFYVSLPLARALAADAGGFDLVHVHALYLFHDWAAWRACRRHRIPYILQPHGALDPYIYRRHRLRKSIIEHLFQDRVTRDAAALLYTTEDERRLAEPHALGTASATAPLGLDLADYAALPPRGRFRARHPAIGERPLLLFLGRLHEKKGLDLIMRAFADGIRRGLDAHLVIAGPDDGMRSSLERQLAADGVADRALFTGMVEGAEKQSLLADADLFLLPSRSENFGLAVIEAMACGLPVLISDQVNLWREVEADGAGRVVPIADSGPLTVAMLEMLADPAALRAMGERARRTVAERYSEEHMGIALEAIYAGVAAGRLPATAPLAQGAH